MQFKRLARKENSENLVPLINIVFLLLIFFMVTAKISPKDPFQIQSPISTVLLMEEKNMENILSLSIKGELAFNDKLVSIDELETLLNYHYFGEKLTPLRLKADENTPVILLLKIMSLLKKFNIKNIELLALKAN